MVGPGLQFANVRYICLMDNQGIDPLLFNIR